MDSQIILKCARIAAAHLHASYNHVDEEIHALIAKLEAELEPAPVMEPAPVVESAPAPAAPEAEAAPAAPAEQ